MEIVDHDDPNFGSNVVESLLTSVRMDLFKFITAIYAVGYSSYLMNKNSIRNFTDAAPYSEAMVDIIYPCYFKVFCQALARA
ncbi:MAG: hypothetical protein KAH18_05730, partial [Psychromonas sp.]|nr:hypothetical protein [Psychromonas sp.]